MLWNKTRCWNSVVYTNDGKILISSLVNGRRQNIVYETIEEAFTSHQKLPEKSGNWVVAISDSDCITKEITLPAANFDEAYNMLEYELHGLVPIDPGGLVYGCYEMSQHADMYNLCVSVIKKSLLDKYYEDLRRINISPDRVLVHSLALREVSKDNEDCTVISANKNAALLIKYASNHMPMLTYFEADSQRELSQKVTDNLSSNNAEDKLLFALSKDMRVDLLEELSGRETTSEREYTAEDISGHQAEGENVMSNLISEGAISICENSKYVNFNLIYAQELKNRAKKKIFLAYAQSGAMVVVLIFLIWFNLCQRNVRLTKEIDSIERQILPIKDVATQVGAKKAQLNAIKQQIHSKGKIIKVFDDLYGYTPADISLTELKIEHTPKGLRVHIKGQSQDHASAFGYTQELKKASYIDGLNIGVGRMIQKEDSKSIVEFSAECFLTEGAI